MSDYAPPSFNSDAFSCPFPGCGTFAHQATGRLFADNHGELDLNFFKAKKCGRCGQISLWAERRLVYPVASTAPPTHRDLPESCAAIYAEASQVLESSPRASAALLRLCLQVLLPEIGGDGKKIDNDIKALVSEGLPPKMQKAMDICRVVGNESVHPGQIDLHDNPEMAIALFKLINMIVEEMITIPRELDSLYDSLPPEKLKGIEVRDKEKK